MNYLFKNCWIKPAIKNNMNKTVNSRLLVGQSVEGTTCYLRNTPQNNVKEFQHIQVKFWSKNLTILTRFLQFPKKCQE